MQSCDQMNTRHRIKASNDGGDSGGDSGGDTGGDTGEIVQKIVQNIKPFNPFF